MANSSFGTDGPTRRCRPRAPSTIIVKYRLAIRTPTTTAGYSWCRVVSIAAAGLAQADVDWLSVMVDWVEHGHPPDRVIASKSDGGKIEMTRPLFRYPATAIYKGTGDPKSADSFVAKEPSPQPH